MRRIQRIWTPLLCVIFAILISAIVPFIVTFDLTTNGGRDKQLRDAEESMMKPPRRVNDANVNLANNNEKNINSEADDHGEKNRNEDREEQEKVEGKEHEHEPLNIVLLYADDWSFRTLGAMERALRHTNYKVPSFVKTPNIDKLAENGVLFTHNCVTTSVCSTSRATLYTGQYASVHKTPQPGDTAMYAPGKWNETLFPLLKDVRGYHNGMIGKWHHAAPPNVSHTFATWEAYFGRHYEDRGGKRVHVTDLNELHAIEFLQQRPLEKPFALFVSMFAIHAEDGNPEQYLPQNRTRHLYENETVPVPKTATEAHFQAMPPFLQSPRNIARDRWLYRYRTPEMYQLMQKKIYRMVTEVDTAVGNIIDTLRKQDVLNKTMIIFTADNGNLYGEHGMCEKWYPYEESLRVPLVVYDPRMPPHMRNTTNDEFTLNIDLAPTMLQAAKIPIPHAMQGRDMAQLYLSQSSQSSWRKEFYYEWFFGDRFGLPQSLAYIRKDVKYITYPEYEYEELFLLSTDPYEETNVFNKTFLQTTANLLEEVQGRFEIAKAAAEMGAKI
eukprot:CAMPEP_0172530134 /NCGR_PEP_ID=MMETSP1067-20121228/3967_1 /TAXON_ID=265564 ORGANISM="Thalassiosira punctigera, Strain Tpunct2005C2" /NCGR_SAMPLE_ID=MMETSP1067 /ASSEMBLY_ACC=CAM_ASM_000444 /LENGTH=553 /DNA_ID=CAMNT_0013314285 /DNA_START=115 /DNA_END=1776 /DNA_ORIENTATION=-